MDNKYIQLNEIDSAAEQIGKLAEESFMIDQNLIFMRTIPNFPKILQNLLSVLHVVHVLYHTLDPLRIVLP